MRAPTTPAKSVGTSSTELCRTPILATPVGPAPGTPRTRRTPAPGTPLAVDAVTPREPSMATAVDATSIMAALQQVSFPPLSIPDRAPWRGVSLGGWLVLEPGPSKALFKRNLGPKQVEARCEWDLMRILRRNGKLAAQQIITAHRETYIQKSDFERIKAMGLNSVRVPFGYWVVLGPLKKSEPYVGPHLKYLDRAVKWAEEVGLQVLLDLHGAPGGESAEAPCGRRQRPLGRWKWHHWKTQQSLRALEIVAKRYAGRKVVTGMAVCNEPSHEVPSEELCKFYDRAIDTIRKAGMPASQVSIVLPVFQRDLEAFATKWNDYTHGKHENYCFEVHWYHCFENHWHGLTFAQHLREVQRHAHELRTRRFPVVVGEWSLALGVGAQPGKLNKEEMRAWFSIFQLHAYAEASHGWFFWTWSDIGGGADWDLQKIYETGNFPLGSLLQKMPELPQACKDTTDDPLEKVFDVPASNPGVCYGDTVYLRAFNGRYLDVPGSDPSTSNVRCQWGDRGRWQWFTFFPFGGEESLLGEVIHDGDVVCVRAHTDCFLGMVGNAVKADWREPVKNCAFIVYTTAPDNRSSSSSGLAHAPEIRHRSSLFLQSLTMGNILAPNESDPSGEDKNKIVAKWKHFGDWQRLVVEKPRCDAVTPSRPRRRSSFPAAPAPASPATPSVRRRLSSSLKGVTLFPSPKRQRIQRRSSMGATASPRRASTSPLRHSIGKGKFAAKLRTCLRVQAPTVSAQRLVRRQSSPAALRRTSSPAAMRRLSSPMAMPKPSSPTRGTSSVANTATSAGATPLRKRKSDSGSGLDSIPTVCRKRNIRSWPSRT